MTPWLIPGALVLVFGIGFFFDSRWKKGKRFALHTVLIDQKKAPNFSITVLKGDLPEDAEPGIVTYVPPRVSTRRGLKSHQIVGCLKYFRGGWNPENFSGNKAFKDKVHAIAATEIPESVRANAKAMSTGEIRLIDDRIATPQESAGDEHCIGIYKVEKGAVIAYAPNLNFQLLSNEGPLQLVESIRRVLYAELETATTSSKNPPSRSTPASENDPGSISAP
jgi:hypothetical protein